MPHRITVAGHICLDITPVFASSKAKPIQELLSPGKVVAIKNASVCPGGAVSNTGLALKTLGADVELVAKIGDDEFGKLILDAYRYHHVEKGVIISKETSTSYSVVLAPPGTDRIFLHHSGANNAFTYTDLDYDRIASSELFHFGYPPVMRHMYEHDGKELIEMFRRIKSSGVLTSLDMAVIDPDSESSSADWEKILKGVLPYVDFFVPSIEEIGYIVNRPLYESWKQRAAGEDLTSVLSLKEDIQPIADTLIEWGAKIVLLKCGAPGLYLQTASADKLQQIGPKYTNWSDIAIFEESYLPDQILSGTGAGDTSIAAFLLSALDGADPKQCLQLATATGASCVSAYDALSGLKPFKDLQDKINTGWQKQKLLSP